jgi:hypothetical protein
MVRLVAVSFCQRRFLAENFSRALYAYCSSNLVHQLMHHTPEISGVLA